MTQTTSSAGAATSYGDAGTVIVGPIPTSASGAATSSGTASAVSGYPASSFDDLGLVDVGQPDPLISVRTAGAAASVGTSWTSLTASATAPQDFYAGNGTGARVYKKARYAAVGIRTDSMAANDYTSFTDVQLQKGSPTSYEDPNRTNISMQADRVNFATNPSAETNLTGWSNALRYGAGTVRDTTLFTAPGAASLKTFDSGVYTDLSYFHASRPYIGSVYVWLAFAGSIGMYTTSWLAPTSNAGPYNRFRRAVYGMGLLAEEGTTNLVFNPTVENDTTNVSSSTGATLTRDNTQSYVGAYSLKVVTPGTQIGEGVTFTAGGTTAGGPVTGSAHVLAAAGSVGVQVNIWVRFTYSDATTSDGPSTTYTLTNQWQRIVSATATDPNPGKTISNASVVVRTATQVAATFYVDGVQAEQKTYATTYCDSSLGQGYTSVAVTGGTGSQRAGTKASWTPTIYQPCTVLGWAKWQTASGSATQTLIDVWDGTVNNRISVYRKTDGTLAMTVNNVVVATTQAMNSGDTVFFAATVSGNQAVLFYSVNGGAVTSATGTVNVSSSPMSALFIGSDNSGAAQSNASIEGVTVLSGALALADIQSIFAAGPQSAANDSRYVWSNLIGEAATLTDVPASAWTRISHVHTTHAHENETLWFVYGNNPGSQMNVDNLLIESGQTLLPYFDGNTPGSDYMWESGGTANLARSHYYQDYATKKARINAAVAEYLPYGSSYNILYAQPPATSLTPIDKTTGSATSGTVSGTGGWAPFKPVYKSTQPILVTS